MTAVARKTAVRIVVDLLVRGEYGTLEAMTRGRRLKAGDIEAAVLRYGRRLVAPPDSEFRELDAIHAAGSTPPSFHIVFPLWTEEEGRSDLSLELRLSEIYSSGYDIELLDLHVL